MAANEWVKPASESGHHLIRFRAAATEQSHHIARAYEAGRGHSSSSYSPSPSQASQPTYPSLQYSQLWPQWSHGERPLQWPQNTVPEPLHSTHLTVVKTESPSLRRSAAAVRLAKTA